jgi:hypothetical protein
MGNWLPSRVSRPAVAGPTGLTRSQICSFPQMGQVDWTATYSASTECATSWDCTPIVNYSTTSNSGEFALKGACVAGIEYYPSAWNETCWKPGMETRGNPGQ